MGGAIAILSALDSEKAGVWPWRGVILSSPAVRVHPDLVRAPRFPIRFTAPCLTLLLQAAPWKIAVGRVIASWLPRLVMEKPLGPEKTSRSRLNVERYGPTLASPSTTSSLLSPSRADTPLTRSSTTAA
jgi:alpha-beta hydrolase superfamily lysophospholipase